MAGRTSQKPRLLCGASLRDGSACRAAAKSTFGGKCEHHGTVAKGAALGWRIRGSRRAGVYVAEQDERVLVADTATQLFDLFEAESAIGRRQLGAS